MPITRGFDMNGRFDTCAVRKSCFLCRMPAEIAKDLLFARISSVYKPRRTLFAENQASRGAFILCEGEAKLFITSSTGKTLILRIAEAGEILGITAALSGRPYIHTAETITPCHISFVRRDDLLRFVAAHPQALQPIVEQLTVNYEAACDQLRLVALASSASAKLARLLLEWHSYAEHANQTNVTPTHLTHEEIAEFIGASRETVTRTLNQFREHQLIRMDGSAVTVTDRAGLEAIVAA